MSIDKEPLSPILVRFHQDLQLNRRGERTQQSYVRNVRKFAEFLKRDPDSASEDDLRNYLLFIKNDRHWSSSTINVAQQALKKFFSLTCPRDWATLKLVRARGEFKLPTVISIGEVHTFLKLVEKPSMLCFFTVVYTLGVRLQEARYRLSFGSSCARIHANAIKPCSRRPRRRSLRLQRTRNTSDRPILARPECLILGAEISSTIRTCTS